MKSEAEIQERLDDLEMQHLNLTARGRMSEPGNNLLLKIGELKWVLEGVTPFPVHKLTWWMCRMCNNVQAYTASDLMEIPGRIPLCDSCFDGTQRIMQRIGFEEITDHAARLDALEVAVGALADAVRSTQRLQNSDTSEQDAEFGERAMNQEAYLEEEFRLLGVKPHIMHYRFPAGMYYTVVTVATRYRETFSVSERRLQVIFNDAWRAGVLVEDHAAYVVKMFSDAGCGVAPITYRDHKSKRIRRVIAKGRLLKLLRQERMK